MKYKIPPLEIPDDEPFKFDALDREQSAKAISNLVKRIPGPFVIAIDSPWGTGKTTFVQMLMATLKKEDQSCLYFNAWKTDFASDPMLAFVGEIDQLLQGTAKNKTAIKKSIEKAKRIATVLAKRAIPVAGKAVTAGILDIDSIAEKAISEFVSDSISDAVDLYTAERDLIDQFRTSLSQAIAKMSEKEENRKIIIFVDELDRCRPNYAVELFERVKHLFDIENVVFVISLDKSQLRVSLKAVYGSGIDADEYLRRFIDLEYLLPTAKTEKFTNSLYERFEFSEYFNLRTADEFRFDSGNLKTAFNSMFDVFDLSLRAREQCFSRIQVALSITPENFYLYPYLLATLAVLQIRAPDVYRTYAFGEGTASDVIDHIRDKPNGAKFIDDDEGTVIEAYLIAAKSSRFEGSPELSKYETIAQDENSDEELRARADKIVKICKDMSFRDRKPPLNYVVSRLELASNFKAI